MFKRLGLKLLVFLLLLNVVCQGNLNSNSGIVPTTNAQSSENLMAEMADLPESCHHGMNCCKNTFVAAANSLQSANSEQIVKQKLPFFSYFGNSSSLHLAQNNHSHCQYLSGHYKFSPSLPGLVVKKE